MGAIVWVQPRLHRGVAFATPPDPQDSSSLMVGAAWGRPALPRKVKGHPDQPETSVRKDRVGAEPGVGGFSPPFNPKVRPSFALESRCYCCYSISLPERDKRRRSPDPDGRPHT